VRAHGINPVCGDELEITARRSGGKVAELRYTGHGCVISQASAAMMGEALEGKSEEKIRALVRAFKSMMLENAPVSALPEELEALSALEGVRKFPLRVKCATLAWNTIAQGLDAAPRSLDMATMTAPAVTFRQIGAALQPVSDPEIHMSIVDLGLVYGAEIARARRGFRQGHDEPDLARLPVRADAAGLDPLGLGPDPGGQGRGRGPRVRAVVDPRTMATEEAKEQLGLF